MVLIICQALLQTLYVHYFINLTATPDEIYYYYYTQFLGEETEA